MDKKTFEEATRLDERCKMCEAILSYFTDDEPKGHKYLETLRKFVSEFSVEFKAFVVAQRDAAVAAFDALHCCAADSAEATTETEG